MNLPNQFDANEWFILTASVLEYTVILFLPKRFRLSQSVFIWVFNLTLADYVDFMIATPPLNLYEINDSPEYELFDVLIYPLLYSPTAYLVIYFYDRWKPRGIFPALYVMGWALLTIGLEWMAEKFYIYKYNGWKLGYSLPAYVILYAANLMSFRFFRSLYSSALRKT
ncbi:hypothetical protein [Paenibacillus hamazuiensis]|uniref:hypothetical protein n=1 Tax=Paenibacillus hamazuiensis TaxID=2936508 RepID=UPI00200C235E|nr:hypothetical protein [Paenibacillus hamazuiensis]